MRNLVALVAFGALLAAGCGDDGGNGDVAAFCDAADRIEQAEPFDHVDDRDAFDAELDEMEEALADARSNAPSDIRDTVEEVAAGMEEVLAALRGIDDPSDEAEVEATFVALGDSATGVTSGSDLDVYLAENCDNV